MLQKACPFDTVCEMNTHIICIPCDEMSRVRDNQCVPYNPWLLYLHSAYCFPLVSYNMSRLLSDLMKTIIMATKISFFLQMCSKLTLSWSASSFLQCRQSCCVAGCILGTDLNFYVWLPRNSIFHWVMWYLFLIVLAILFRQVLSVSFFIPRHWKQEPKKPSRGKQEKNT